MTAQREHLEKARHAMLHAHKALLEAERVAYERMRGRIESNGAFLQLVLHDPWFAWLRPVSELIAQIDEWMDEDQPAPDAPQVAETMLAQARELRPLEQGTEFQRRYYRLLQESPAVAVAQAEARKLFDA